MSSTWKARALPLAVVALLGAGLTACGGSSNDSTSTSGGSSASSGDKLVVGISSRGWTVPPLKDAGQQAEAAAKEAGDVEIQFGFGDDGPTQVNAVQSLIAKGVDVLAIDPNDDKAIVPVVKEANEAGIPVIMWVGGSAGGDVATTILTSEVKGGELVGDWVADRLGDRGSVALLQGQAAHPAGRQREDGFRAALKKHPGVELSNYAEGQWVRDVAETTATNFLTRTPDLNAIVALNDEMALGALTAVKARGSDALVTGYNGQCTALESVWNGDLTATLYQPFGDIGREIVKQAVKLKRGESVPATITLPEFVVDKAMMEKISDGSKSVSPGTKAAIDNAIKGCD